MKKTVAVVVTYNRKDLLINCINCILNQTSGNPDVLVIDNNSTDGTPEIIKEKYVDDSRVIYINTGANLGGAGGFSFGINKAANMGYDYLWIMDDDTFACKTALEELIKAANLLDDDFGFLSSYVKWTNDGPCIMNLPRVKIEWYFGDIDKQFGNRMIMVESSSFVSMFVKTSTVKEVGLPIKEFFIWADDVEYALRISNRYNSYFVYQSQVVHAIKANTGPHIVSDQDESRMGRYVYLYRNKHYIARHKSMRARMSYWIEVNSTVWKIMRSSSKKKMKRIGIVYRGYIKGLFFNPKIESVHETE